MARSAKKRHGARPKRQDRRRNGARDSDSKHTPHSGQEEIAAPPVGKSNKDNRDDEQSLVESTEGNTSSDGTLDSDSDTEDPHYHPFVRAAIKSAKAISAWKKGHATWKEARKAGPMPYIPKSKCLQAIEYLDPSFPGFDAEPVDDKPEGYSTAYIKATVEKELKKEAWQGLLNAAVTKELEDDAWEYFMIALRDDEIELRGRPPKGPEETMEFVIRVAEKMGEALATMITNRSKELVETRATTDLQTEFDTLDQTFGRFGRKLIDIGQQLSSAKHEAKGTHLKDLAEGRADSCLKAIDEVEQAVKEARKQIVEFRENFAGGKAVSRVVQHHAAKVFEGFTWGPSPKFGGPAVPDL